LPTSSCVDIVRLSMYSSACTLSPRCFAMLSGGTELVTRMIGTFESTPFLHFSNTRKPAFFSASSMHRMMSAGASAFASCKARSASGSVMTTTL